MKNLCIVPFTNKEYPLVLHLNHQYKITALVSPKGIGLQGEDIAVLRNTGPTGYQFSNSIEDGIARSEVILISDVPVIHKSLYAFAVRALETAIAERKEILCFLRMDSTQAEEYKRQCSEEGILCELFNLDSSKSDEDPEDLILQKMGVPVLYINETIPNCDGYGVFLQLIDRLKRDKKRVLGVSEDTYNILFSEQSLSFWKHIPPSDMVYRVNRKIYELTQKLHPDIILIKLPEPMMKYDDENPFDFGMTAFLVSQAVPGDGCVCCTYSGTPYAGFWDNISDSFSVKFGYPILAVHVSNLRIDTASEYGLPTLYTPISRIRSEISVLNQYNRLPFYHLSEPDDFEKFYRDIVLDVINLPYGVI